MVITEGSAGVYSLVYVSTAQILFTSARVDELLSRSRTNNARRGITGVLLLRDGAFLHLLEGPRPAVEQLFRKIKVDERHFAIMTIAEGFAARRRFPEQPMDFHNLRDPANRDLPGFAEFVDTPITSMEFSAEPAHAMRLLQCFQAEVLSAGGGTLDNRESTEWRQKRQPG